MRQLLIFFASISLTFEAFGSGQPVPESTRPVHISTTFRFDVDAPFTKAASLFGPQSEKSWAGEAWNPTFLYPQPGKDTPGAVFTVANGSHTGTWVNTRYDEARGEMQYVAVIPQIVVSIIDVKLTLVSATKTRVDVRYTRTALDAAANHHVSELARHDAASGPEWSNAIRKMLSASNR